MRALAAWPALVVAAVVVAGCPGAPSGDIEMVGVRFDPDDVTIGPGAELAWVNRSGDVHTVTSDEPGGPLDSGDVEPGRTFRFRFDAPGVYRYHCVPHASGYPDGSFAGMVGTVTVRA